MKMQAMLEDLGLGQSASQHEILTSIRARQQHLEYLITAIDDQDERQEYLREITLLSKMTNQLKESKQLSQNNDLENVHLLPVENIQLSSSGSTRSSSRASIIASMSGKTIESLAGTEEAIQAESNKSEEVALVAEKSTGSISTPRSEKPKSSTLAIITAVVIVSIIVVAILIDNGKIALSNSDEVAFKIATVEKIRGEINSYQSSLEKAQLQQRSNPALNPAVNKINNQINSTIFNANQFSEIDGKISMGESFLKQEKFSQATTILTSVKDSYKTLWSQYLSSQEAIASIQSIMKSTDHWQKLNKLHLLQRPAEINLANTARDYALVEMDKGNFHKASQHLKSAELNWLNAHKSIKQQIEIQQLEAEKKLYEIAEAERLLQVEIQTAQEIAAQAELDKQRKEQEQIALERQAAIDAKKKAEALAIDAKKKAEALAIQQEQEKQLALLQEAKLSEKLTPITRVQPKYPNQALLNATQGWVDVGFNITASGIPKDIVILNAEPKRIFNKAALNAIKQWTFKPLIANGKNIERNNASYRMEFVLVDP